MADNVAITAGAGTSIATDDVSSVHYQRIKLDYGADGAAAPATATTPYPVKARKVSSPADATFTRPADTTAYSIGDLIANSTTAGSVTRMSFTGATLTGAGGEGYIVSVAAQKSTSTAASVRAHFLKTDHAVTNGDNGALLFTSLDPDNYIGYVDLYFTGTAEDTIGTGGNEVAFSECRLPYTLSSGDTIYAVLQARTAFTPANAGTYGLKPVFEVTA